MNVVVASVIIIIIRNICGAPFTDKIRTAVHYIVSKNQKLTIKSSVKNVCFQPALETVQSRCSSEFVWQRIPRCRPSV